MKKKPQSSAGATQLRHRAEQRLQERKSKLRPARIESDAQRLVHELQVHQVELEMQNAELQEARQRLESLLEKYTELYDFAPVGYFSLVATGRVQFVNLTGARLLGMERSRLIGRNFSQQVAAECRPDFSAFLQRVFASEARQSCEVKLANTGRPRRVVSIEAERGRDQQECRAVVIDITSRKQEEAAKRRVGALAAANRAANEEIVRRRLVESTLRRSERRQRRLVAEAQRLHTQLRHVTHQILHAQEEERRKISRELHDEVAQILAGINVRLAALSKSASIEPRDLRKRVAQTQRFVEEAIEVVHRFARELRPSMLDDLGLVPALRSYIRDLPASKGLRIRLEEGAGIETLDNPRSTVLYRVAQEALTNVIRHAHAREVTVRLRKIGGAVRIEVRDDGKSFRVDRIKRSKSGRRLGLLGMRERVEMVGGKLTIESTPGEGTTVRADVPLRTPPRKSTS